MDKRGNISSRNMRLFAAIKQVLREASGNVEEEESDGLED